MPRRWRGVAPDRLRLAGDLAGVSVVDGELVPEAVNGRTSLLLPGAGRRADVARVDTALTVAAADGATQELDGLNRAPG